MKLLVGALFFAAAVASTGCSHAVVIDSDPTGAEIKVNGEKIGKAPTTYNETTGWEKVYDIEASLPGYKPTRKAVKQTEWNLPVTAAATGGTVVWIGVTFGAGLFLPWPVVGLFWARQLPDRVVINLDKGPGTGILEPGAAPPPSSYGY